MPIKMFNKVMYSASCAKNSNENYIRDTFEDMIKALNDRDFVKFNVRYKRLSSYFGFAVNGKSIHKVLNKDNGTRK